MTKFNYDDDNDNTWLEALAQLTLDNEQTINRIYPRLVSAETSFPGHIHNIRTLTDKIDAWHLASKDDKRTYRARYALAVTTREYLNTAKELLISLSGGC